MITVDNNKKPLHSRKIIFIYTFIYMDLWGIEPQASSMPRKRSTADLQALLCRKRKNLSGTMGVFPYLNSHYKFFPYIPSVRCTINREKIIFMRPEPRKIIYSKSALMWKCKIHILTLPWSDISRLLNPFSLRTLK